MITLIIVAVVGVLAGGTFGHLWTKSHPAELAKVVAKLDEIKKKLGID